jgi:hypothetical protein
MISLQLNMTYSQYLRVNKNYFNATLLLHLLHDAPSQPGKHPSLTHVPLTLPQFSLSAHLHGLEQLSPNVPTGHSDMTLKCYDLT